MRCTATTSEPLKGMAQALSLLLTDRAGQPAASEFDAILQEPCVATASFCRCWMPAWFHLAEIVAHERVPHPN